MIKVLFKYDRHWNDTVVEEFEFEDDIKDEEIDKEFEEWVWGLIQDKVYWEREDQ